MQYRPDIDGLRSIAVLFVIFFHFGFSSLSGGYVGVDVFFVLSGYLIGSILFKHLNEENFSFSYFYFRRIRRLFPVYVVVMLLTTVFAYLWMLPKDFREFGQSLFASTLYASNILFYMEAGYFDTVSHIKPLLHTWSLSVEEQFYLLFPALAWLTYKISRKFVVATFIGLTIISFVLAVYYIDIDNSAVFYLYPFRAWEMFIGTILALKCIPTVSGPKTNNALSLSGLAMILYAGFFFDDSTKFPGVSALLPCLGTALIIYTGNNQLNWIHRALSNIVPVFIGKLSYSLYLWHWPVYVLYTYNVTYAIGLLDGIIMFTLVFLLSYLSWKFVEAPFRTGKAFFSHTRASVYTSTALISALFLAIGFYISHSNGIPERLSPEEAHFAAAANDLFGDFKNCKGHDNDRYPNIRHCEMGDALQAEKFTLIWGDSHGGAFKRGFQEATKKTGSPSLLAWAGGCPTAFDVEKDESVASTKDDQKCTTQNKALREFIHANKNRISSVLFIGRWSYYLNGEGVGSDVHNKISVWPAGQQTTNIDQQKINFLNALESSIKEIHAAGIKVFVLEQAPEFGEFNARKFAISLINGSSTLDEVLVTYGSENLQAVRDRQDGAIQLFESLNTQRIITLLPTHSYFCQNEQCSVMLDDRPAYFDNNHVSSYGAAKISTLFTPLVEHIQSTSNEKN
ncbi:MAG: acyltransferase [Agarilytica sp.]